MEISPLLIQLIVLFQYSIPLLGMEFSILTTWEGLPVNHDPVKLWFQGNKTYDGITVDVKAQYFNDPPAPSGKPGEPFKKLWEYEVVELFFLGNEENYLEIELCPHGQHLVLLLSGRRNVLKECLPLMFKSKIEEGFWYGRVEVPASYFPPGVHSFNAYAIHGSKKNRVYESLFPVPQGHFSEPDFHRLEYFKPFAINTILPVNSSALYSDIWRTASAVKDMSKIAINGNAKEFQRNCNFAGIQLTLFCNQSSNIYWQADSKSMLLTLSSPEVGQLDTSSHTSNLIQPIWAIVAK